MIKFTVNQEVHYEFFGGDRIGAVTHVYPSGQAKVKLDDDAELTYVASCCKRLVKFNLKS